MNLLKKFFGVAVLLMAFAASAFGQAALTSTTLSAAVTDTSGSTWSVTSATGFTANSTVAYVDKELVIVRVVSGTTITVVRGQGGTRSTTHASGAVIYVGKQVYFSAYDRSGSCTATSELVLPVINAVNGRIYDCRNSIWIQLSDGGTMAQGGTPVRSACTGVAGSAETEFLNGAACSGATTATARQVISSYGTLANLRAFSSAAVVGGSSKDVVTVLKNGSATVITCTIAASGTACSDIAHAVAVVPGDVITFSFVSATSDTAANVSASVEKY